MEYERLLGVYAEVAEGGVCSKMATGVESNGFDATFH